MEKDYTSCEGKECEEIKSRAKILNELQTWLKISNFDENKSPREKRVEDRTSISFTKLNWRN